MSFYFGIKLDLLLNPLKGSYHRYEAVRMICYWNEHDNQAKYSAESLIAL